MTKARQLADLGNAYDDGALSNRNIIINGAMKVAQRGTSVSSQTGSGYKTIDRFYTNASGATYSQSQQTVTVGGETGLPLQFSKFLRHQVTTGDNWSQIYHKIEDVTSVPTGTVTLSFYAKGTSPNAGLSFIAWQNFGSGGSSEVTVTISPTVTLTSTWQRFTVNITVPSVTGKTIGTGSHFYFGIGQGGSTSTNAWTLDITGVQLELGDTATPFEHKNVGQELLACQRYYQQVDRGSGIAPFSTAAYISLPYITTMRAIPTFGTTGALAVNDARVNTIQSTAHVTAYNPNISGSFIQLNNFSGLVQNSACLMRGHAGTFVTLDAEL